MEKIFNQSLNKFIYRLFICFMLLFIVCIFDKYEYINIKEYQEKMNGNIKILNVVNVINGKLNLIDLGSGEEIAVSKEYNNIIVTNELTKIDTNEYIGIKNYNAGVVIKIEKDSSYNKDNTYNIYIESIDGNIYKYSNLDTVNTHIYKYIKTNDIIGSSSDYYYINKVSE